jgi:hypothetical protein
LGITLSLGMVTVPSLTMAEDAIPISEVEEEEL